MHLSHVQKNVAGVPQTQASFSNSSLACPGTLNQTQPWILTTTLILSHTKELESQGHGAICGMNIRTYFANAWCMNCIYFFDKLFLNISSFLLIEEEPHVSMPFFPVFHINYFLAMFVCIIIADIKAKTIFAL